MSGKIPHWFGLTAQRLAHQLPPAVTKPYTAQRPEATPRS
jgi:hypothetical protein